MKLVNPVAKLSLNENRPEEERGPIEHIFHMVDEVIWQGQQEKELSLGIEFWKLRQLLFTCLYGLLRAKYIGDAVASSLLVSESGSGRLVVSHAGERLEVQA